MMRPDGTLPPECLAQYTRALVPLPAAIVPPRPRESTFVWTTRPRSGVATGVVYTDGSLLDGGFKLAGLCSRLGWALVVRSAEGEIVAAAHGVPPGWVDSIQGAELWAVRMATAHTEFCASYRVDCETVQKGFSRGREWACAGRRRYARIWAPVFASLDGQDEAQIVWMPAHTLSSDVGSKVLSDGSLLTHEDRDTNAEADKLAKEAAATCRAADNVREKLVEEYDRTAAIARWIGEIAVIASETVGQDGGRLRDAAPPSGRRPNPRPRRSEAQRIPPPLAERGLPHNPRWQALLQRVRAREAAARLSQREPEQTGTG